MRHFLKILIQGIRLADEILVDGAKRRIADSVACRALHFVNGKPVCRLTAKREFETFVAQRLRATFRIFVDYPSSIETAYFKRFPFEAAAAVMTTALANFKDLISFFFFFVHLTSPWKRGRKKNVLRNYRPKITERKEHQLGVFRAKCILEFHLSVPDNPYKIQKALYDKFAEWCRALEEVGLHCKLECREFQCPGRIRWKMKIIPRK